MISLSKYLTESIKQSFTLTAVGDALLHKEIYRYFKTDSGYDFTDLFSRYPLDKNNLNYVNVESLIGGSELGVKGSILKREENTYQPHFNSPREFGDALVNHGFNLMSLANNHVLDEDEPGVLNSLKYWGKQPVVCAGSYKDDNDRFKKRVYEKNGIKYAFFAYTMKHNTKKNFPNHPFYRNDWDEKLVELDIKSIRNEVDLIIVSIHWGEEHTFTQNQTQIKAAEYLASLGVDIVLGMHSHCVQPVQYIGKTLVAYSLGNFIARQLYDLTDSRVELELTVKVTKENNNITLDPSFRLLYMYYSDDYKHFKVIPFDDLNETELPNKDCIERTYSDIVNKYKIFD